MLSSRIYLFLINPAFILYFVLHLLRVASLEIRQSSTESFVSPGAGRVLHPSSRPCFDFYVQIACSPNPILQSGCFG